jgi:hypothetical protein
MAISRVTASLASGINENTLALANFNVDFSLFKLEAPQEFKGLGLSLTPQRRELAEDGRVHRTARRLGALFEEITPLTPNLIRAYGSRASEISESIAKEEISQKHGVFAACAGVDATSVWAAATSGKSAIAVHLLACMLTRAWSGPHATSIWVELVAERRRALKERMRDGMYDTSLQLSLAISEDLSRSDLAQWDSSTRAWLQIADDVQIRRQKQLMLIVNNVNMPVNQGTHALTTYFRVMEAWVTAMESLEKLISGQHQRISKGSVLLGLASWHLYPSLLVLGEKTSKIDFNDPVLDDSGQLTVGLRDPNPDHDEGVYWSLSLAHLRYYGDPVKVTSFTTRDASRLTIDEFHLLVLGSIISDWGNLRPDFDAAAKFFVALDERIQRVNHQGKYYLHWEYSWIRLLSYACQSFLNLKGPEKDIASNIIALGHRRGRSLLSGHGRKPPPMLGLCYPWIQTLLSLQNQSGINAQVEMMRFIARKLDLRHDQCIIRTQEGPATFHAYVTALPHEENSDSKAHKMHIKWIERLSGGYNWKFSCGCHDTGHSCHTERCPCMHRGLVCSSECHPEFLPKVLQCPGCKPPGLNLGVTSVEYGCDNMVHGVSFNYVQSPLFNLLDQKDYKARDWDIGQYAAGTPCAIRLGRGGSLCTCFHKTAIADPTFVLLAGSQDGVGLFIRTDVDVRAQRHRIYKALVQAQSENLISVPEVCATLRSDRISGQSLIEYLEFLYNQPVAIPTFRKDLRITSFHATNYFEPLHGLSLATKAYRELPGATISLHLISTPLNKAHWIPDFKKRHLSRQEKLACIAMLESGSYNIHPGDLNDVIAISARNSIFVSRLLVNDPFALDHVDDVKRVVGNVGRTGMVLMFAPQAPRIRKSDLQEWKCVMHAPFDGKLENSFSSTSLHLRFTEFEMAYNIGNRGAIDKDLCFVETLIEVYERDKWVADIDVLPLFQSDNDFVRRNTISCRGCSKEKKLPRELMSFDHWEELLDVPEGLGKNHVGVIRAHDNWLARLAAACVCLQRDFRIVLNPTQEVCWHCCCRKKWGWSRDTVLKSAKARCCTEDLETDGDEDEPAYESDDSGESDLPIETLEIDSEARDPETGYESGDAGYASDDTIVRTGSSDEEVNIIRFQMPQIFIA